LGLRYNEHHQCNLEDEHNASTKLSLHDINYHQQDGNIDQGARVLIDLLEGAKVSRDGGNPPAEFIQVKITCLLKSPVQRAERENANHFRCAVIDI
jgi:hypothetical protein